MLMRVTANCQRVLIEETVVHVQDSPLGTSLRTTFLFPLSLFLFRARTHNLLSKTGQKKWEQATKLSPNADEGHGQLSTRSH